MVWSRTGGGELLGTLLLFVDLLEESTPAHLLNLATLPSPSPPS